jgi:hypothetical protein
VQIVRVHVSDSIAAGFFSASGKNAELADQGRIWYRPGMRKRPAASNDPAPEFPKEEEVEVIEDDLPPAPDPTEIVPPSTVGLTEGELRQRIGQHEMARVNAASARGADDLAASLEELSARYKGGYLRVERMGPSELPRSELGDLGKLKLKDLDLSQDLAEAVHGQYGGGEYRVTAYTGRGRASPDEPMVLDVAGDIKPRSQDGHAYLNRRNQAGGGDGPDNATTQALNLLREKMNEPKPADATGGILAQVLTAVLSKNDAKEAREEAKIRADADVKAAEEKTKQVRLELESKERLERERLASEERKHQATEDTKARIAEARSSVKYDFLGRKVEANVALKREELKAAGPLGPDGSKQLNAKLVDIAITNALDRAGLSGDPEEESKLGGFLMKLAEENGPRIFDLLDRLTGPKTPGAPGRAALPPPATEAAADAIDVAQAAPGAPAAGGPAADGASPAADVAPVAPQVPPDEASAIAAAGAQRVLAFLNQVAVQMKMDGDAAAAWAEPIDENPVHDLEWLYGRMQSGPREALASAGWIGLRSSIDHKLPGIAVAVAHFDGVMKDEKTADWWAKFCDEGPWNAED